MRILIVEDERPAAKRLQQLIKKSRPSAEIIEVIDSVESAIKWLRHFPAPDLAFFDIQLADGMSFDIFNHVELNMPLIFTTAYDQYTLKAFKVNSVDYLLKPIDPEELDAAFFKYDRLYKQGQELPTQALQQLLQSMQQKQYKERFLVKVGQQLHYIEVKDIAYFYSEDGFVHAMCTNGKKHIIDYTLDQLEAQLDRKFFFRINRKIILHLQSIKKIHTYFNSRLKLDLQPVISSDVIVSRDRVGDFKEWLDR